MNNIQVTSYVPYKAVKASKAKQVKAQLKANGVKYYAFEMPGNTVKFYVVK